MRPAIAACLAGLALATFVGTRPAHAIAEPGTPAPNITKNELVGGGVGPAWSLSAQAGKVVILFVLGYS